MSSPPPQSPSQVTLVALECAVPIRSQIFTKLRFRDESQCRPFVALIQINTELSQREQALTDRIGALEREVAVLKADNELLRRGKEPSAKTPGLSESDTATLVANQQLIAKLRSDLTDSYKRNSENAREMLQLNYENKQLNEKLTQRDKEVTEIKLKMGDGDTLRKKYEQDIQEKEVTLAVLRSELQSLQVDYIRQEETAKKLHEENGLLVDRWLRKMSEEANQMNEANQLFQSLKQKEQEMTKLSSSTTPQQPSPPLAPIQPEGKSAVFIRAASMLDASQHPDMLVKIPVGPKKLLEGHTEDINSIAYNISGTLIVSGGNDKTIRVWDVSSGASKAVLTGAMQSVMAVNFSVNDDFVLGCSNDNAARVWAVQNARLRHTLTGHVGKVFCGIFADNTQKVVTGSHDRTLKVWDLGKGYCVRTVFCFSSCNDICIGQSASIVISAHVDKNLRFWDIRNGQCEHVIDGLHSSHITSVCLSNDTKYALTCGRDNSIHLVDTAAFNVVTTYKHDDFRTGSANTKACFSPDGHYVAASSANGSIFIWNAYSAKLEKVLPPRTNTSVGCATAWNPCGYQVATSDKSVCVLWE